MLRGIVKLQATIVDVDKGVEVFCDASFELNSPSTQLPQIN
jgi:hypothetical protein